MSRHRQRRQRKAKASQNESNGTGADGSKANDVDAQAPAATQRSETETFGSNSGESAGSAVGPALPEISEKNEPFVAQTTTHFLPKFDNQNADKRLGWLLSGAEAEASLESADEGVASILYVSKKHSGSLVMAPPFYSKNGTGNEFSRVGCVLLYEYFLAVWPDEGASKFKAWWDDAERRGICYSFECVTPRVLGDHGATPRCAYMVLTCATVTREERFMSPSELLQVATAWRLPLNEVWLVPGDRAHDVEKELHSRRWEMQDRDASAILDKHLLPGQEPQRFLSHAETQGQVLEGFVLMALQANPERLAALVKVYNDTMRPHHDAALASAARLGEICLDPVKGKDFRASVNKLEVAPLNHPDIYREPVRLGKSVPTSDVWDRVCAETAPGRMQTLFRRLRNLYAHSVNLQPYIYADRLQVQVHVRDDEVFYGWPLHMMDESTGPLFRGMVVTLFPQEEANARAEQAPALEAPTPVKILGIAKLKCLNYMWRTFGVRNRLFILLKRGKEDFLKTLRKGFYPPWSIPQEHRGVLDGFFRKWADFALSLPAKQQDALRTNYLETLERFLVLTPYPLGTPRAEVGPHAVSADDAFPDPEGLNAISAPGPPGDQLSILVLNLSGLNLSASKLGALGLDADSNRVLEGVTEGRQGFYEVTTRFPKEDQVKAANALLVMGLDANDPEAITQLSENQRKAAEGSLRGFTKRVMPKLGAKTQTPIVMNPSDAATWLSAVRDSATRAAPTVPVQEGPKGKTSTPATARERPKRLVLCTLALPPGGGKSSLFDAFATSLRPRTPQVRFCYRSSDDSKSRSSFESEFTACLQGRSNKKNHPKGDPAGPADILVVGYDKNIPNVDGVRRLIAMLKPQSSKFDLRILPIVPEVLDHDAFWNRVQARDAATHIGLAIGAKLSKKEAYRIFRSAFFEQCEEFLGQATHAPGAMVSDIFTRRVESAGNPLLPLAADASADIADFAAGCSFADFVEWADAQDTPSNESAPDSGNKRVAPERANWCCADVDGFPSLHVTLVPPPSSTPSLKESASGPNSQRKGALQALQSVAGRTVKIRASKYHRAFLADRNGTTTEDAGTARKRRREDNGPPSSAKYIGFWEVDEVEGLPSGLDLGLQQDILHITDRASISRGVRAKQAGQVMRQIKRQRSGLAVSESDAEPKLEPNEDTWIVETEQHPLSVTATIAFYR